MSLAFWLLRCPSRYPQQDYPIRCARIRGHRGGHCAAFGTRWR